MEHKDLIIIGAGINGLTCASTYHQLHPEASVLIMDAASSIGGPWAPYRTFPGLKTNNLVGMYEHPEFPMDEERFGVKKGEHIPAEKMLEYLTAFVEDSDISSFLRLNTRVEVVEKIDEGWKLQCQSKQKIYDLTATKLIIAVGNTNKPKMPNYPNISGFEPPVIHSHDFPAQYSTIAKPEKHTLIIGAGKSAYDIAYACASQPNPSVTILIRPSGNGPSWMSPSHVTPLKMWLEKLVFTRFFGFMSPCPWARTTGLEGWLRAFLHRTRLGNTIARVFWKILGDDVIALNKLHNHLETKKLLPWRGAFEVGASLGVHNYPTNFYDLVRDGKVRIVFDEVERFGARREVVLKSGQRVDVDAVVCATGWEVGNTIRFRPDRLEKELGLPTTAPPTPSEATLIHQTELSLLRQYPILNRDTSRINHPDPSLRHTPIISTPTPQSTSSSTSDQVATHQQPYRLHAFLIPPSLLSSHSIAFAGALYCLGTFPCAYIQSLWIAAYFHNQLSTPLPTSHSDVLKTTYRDTQYCVLRIVGGYGDTAPDLVFDSLSYFDVLMGDLGLDGRRLGGNGEGKGICGWWWREWFGCYGPQNYKGLVREWVEKEEGLERKWEGEGKKDV